MHQQLIINRNIEFHVCVFVQLFYANRYVRSVNKVTIARLSSVTVNYTGHK